MKYIIGCMAILLPILSRAQAPPIKALAIGDTVPDITLTNVYNYPSSTIRLSDLKGKLVILDFMSTGCIPCIKILPAVDSLQKKYNKRLQMILVSNEKEERIEYFLKKNSYLDIPFIASDTTLSGLFPHQYISHIAWIDASGIVRGITHSEYINEKNIDALLQGLNVKWPVKRDVTTYDFTQPLFSINETNVTEFSLPTKTFYTAFTNYMPGIQKFNNISADSSRQVLHVSFINRSIIEIYLLLYQHYHLPMSQVSLEAKTRNRLVYNPANGYYDDWKEKNFYCLDAVLPANVPWPVQQKKIISDWDFFLGLQGRIERRSVNCLVLKNKNASSNKKDTTRNGLRVGMITYLLNNVVGNVPVIDETSGTTYLSVPVSEQEVKEDEHFKKILDRYGFQLIPEKRELEFLVITEQ